MKRLPSLKTIVLAAVSIGAAVPALAAAQIDQGKQNYESHCALCHGKGGRGDGTFGELLKLTIPDLTTLSRRNGGVFPADRVYAVIDGREAITAHGPREMPIWGTYFATGLTPEHDDYPHAPESFVRSRILALIDYLGRLQAK